MASFMGGLGNIVRRAVGMAPEETEIKAGERGPAPYPIGDELDPIKYAAYSRELMEEQRASMSSMFITWTQNILFLAGLQWFKYDPMAGAFTLPNLPKWKERPVRNLLLPIFKTFLGKVTKNRPAGVCIPASTEPQHIQAAQLGNEVIEAKWFELKLPKILRRALTWVFTTGNAWVMTYWNTDSGLLMPLTAQVQGIKHDELTGDPVMNPGQPMMDGLGQPMVDEMGQPMLDDGDPVMELIECPCDENGDPILDEQGNYDLEASPAIIDIGEVGYKVFSGFQVFPEAGAEADEDIRHFLIAEPLTLRDIYQRWPHAKRNVIPEDTTQIDRFAHLVSIFASGADTHIASSQTKRDAQIPKGLVLHYYERPNQEKPEGRHWVSVGDQLLEAPGPLPDGIWPPVRRLYDVEVTGRYHAEATLTAGIGPQREYNEGCAQIKEHNNLMQRGKWLVPRGSQIGRGQITNEPGEVIQHTPGMEPKMADIKPLPLTVFEERDRALQDLQSIMGMHQSTMGEAPPGVTSGRAFLTLQEADDTDLGPFIEMLETVVAEINWDTLRLIQRNYTEERLLRISGKNNSFRVKAFKGEDLTGVVGVKPQAGSAFPWSASARQSMLIDLGTSFPNLFVDPETGAFDSERFRRMLPLGGMESVDDSGDLDIAEALREEEIFKEWNGAIDPMTNAPDLPTPMPWQNHQAHLKQHASLLKSADFFDLAQEVQDAFVQHWMATAQAFQAQQMPVIDADGDGIPESPAAPGTAGALAAVTDPMAPGGAGAGITAAGDPSAEMDAARADVNTTRQSVAGPT